MGTAGAGSPALVHTRIARRHTHSRYGSRATAPHPAPNPCIIMVTAGTHGPRCLLVVATVVPISTFPRSHGRLCYPSRVAGAGRAEGCTRLHSSGAATDKEPLGRCVANRCEICSVLTTLVAYSQQNKEEALGRPLIAAFAGEASARSVRRHETQRRRRSLMALRRCPLSVACSCRGRSPRPRR